jgi:hypothetical protein
MAVNLAPYPFRGLQDYDAPKNVSIRSYLWERSVCHSIAGRRGTFRERDSLIELLANAMLSARRPASVIMIRLQRG